MPAKATIPDLSWNTVPLNQPLTFYSLTVIYRTTSINIQIFYMVLTQHLSVLCGLLPCKILTDWYRKTEVENVYCAVRTESLDKTDKFRL